MSDELSAARGRLSATFDYVLARPPAARLRTIGEMLNRAAASISAGSTTDTEAGELLTIAAMTLLVQHVGVDNTRAALESVGGEHAQPTPELVALRDAVRWAADVFDDIGRANNAARLRALVEKPT